MSINKVAKLAGVSNSTVSRVINKHPCVAPSTERAVRDAMARLNYTPSDRRPGPKPHARTVRSTRTRIAFLMLGGVRSQATPAFEQLVHGVSLGAASFGMDLTLFHVSDPHHLELKPEAKRVDGLILHGDTSAIELKEQLPGTPAVWLMGNRRRPTWGDQVLPDTFRIGELAASHLLSRGHKRLAYLCLDESHLPFQLVAHAFRLIGQQHGATVSILQVRSRPQESYWHSIDKSSVDDIIRQLKQLPDPPTGFFIADDQQTAVLQPELQRAGIPIGQSTPGKRVDVISCNNERPYLVGLAPIPAVIDIRVEAIGRRGVEQLAWRLANPNVGERFSVAVEPALILAPTDEL